MSVRAYRVNEIKTEDNPSFNLWYSDALMDYLRENADTKEESGLISFDLEVLQGALDIPDLEQEYKDALKKDIEWAKAQGDTDISYLCF